MFLLSRVFRSCISSLLVFAGIAFASPERAIHGTVSDPTGAIVTNAKVELIENGVVAVTVMTDTRGRYSVFREVVSNSRLRVSHP